CYSIRHLNLKFLLAPQIKEVLFYLLWIGGGSMADNFGLKIGVEGEREFKKSLREINKSFRVLGSEMKLLTSEFNRNDKSIKAITARNAELNKEIDAQKEKVSTLEKALSNAVVSFGENDRSSLSWQTQVNK